MNEEPTEDTVKAQERVPTQPPRDQATDLQPNDDPIRQKELTGEGMTAPDDTLGG